MRMPLRRSTSSMTIALDLVRALGAGVAELLGGAPDDEERISNLVGHARRHSSHGRERLGAHEGLPRPDEGAGRPEGEHGEEHDAEDRQARHDDENESQPDEPLEERGARLDGDDRRAVPEPDGTGA